jgi:hypothetical protein
MKTYITIFCVSLLAALFTGCKKEEDNPVPSGIIDTYTLPQGNHAFDQTILNYYQKYGSYLLYQFNDRDAYWTPTGWKKPVASTTAVGFWSTGVDILPSDTNYIAAQLDLIQQKWFSYYSDKFLKQFLPVKILLCSKLDSIYTSYVFSPSGLTYVKNAKTIPAYYSYDNITVNYGNAAVNTMTAEDKRIFLAKVNLVFIQNIIGRSLTAPVATFTNSADYVTTMTTIAQAYGKGIISGYFSPTALADWNAYITAMVTLSEDDLNASVANTDATAMGILNATKDTNGKIRQRYTIVRNYFINEYQVDLQKIGNAAKGK